MAWLNFNPYAYDLESAVKIVRGGLDAAERALQEDEDRVKAEMAENDLKIASGEIPGYEIDEDGDLLFDPNEGYHYDFETIRKHADGSAKKHDDSTLSCVGACRAEHDTEDGLERQPYGAGGCAGWGGYYGCARNGSTSASYQPCEA
ncbi:hypothetical protein [Sphingomonas sp. TREG-RG-20F-R18-01]|uniref:hypothetical protein n=1 Tax=Sphingomonas sp. TREG-RG-20F-R18-01 TaxID=2914982 RepID=UPI001F59F083|nr:hypothetical protein [Sphingomonas sp. TREG-RG-20F-R18-01]